MPPRDPDAAAPARRSAHPPAGAPDDTRAVVGARSPGATHPGGFYGWRMVALTAVCLALTAPGQTVGVSVFVDPMIGALDLTRSQVALAYLVGTLGGAVALPAVGSALDRLGVRRMVLGIALAFGGVLVAMAGVRGFWTLLLGFLGIRALGQGALNLTASTSVALWFDRRRGLAVGLSSAAGQAMMSLAPLALAATIAAVGWRGAWVAAAAVVWAVLLPVAIWGLRDSPAALGQHLDGGHAPTPHEAAGRDAAAWTRAEATRTPIFWVLAAAVAAAGMISTALGFHQISLLGERGLTVAEAAANFIPQTVAGIGATLGMGVLVDRVAPRGLLAGTMALLAAALLLARTAEPGLLAIAFGIAVGAAGGALRSLETAALPRWFGLRHVGAIRGLVVSMNVAATAFGPLALSLGRDLSGSYGPVMLWLVPVPLAVGVASLLVQPPSVTPPVTPPAIPPVTGPAARRGSRR